MDKPFAITLDVGSSLANKTGSLAHRARRLRRPPAALQPRLPGRREHPAAGSTRPRRAARATSAAWRKIMEDNPFPAIMGRVCYHPCETACNRGQLDEAVGINSVERFLGDEAIRNGWTRRGPAPADAASACWSSAPGRPGSRPPTTSTRLGHDGDDPRRRPDGRRHDALRHPQVPAAARRARRRGRSGSSTWASTLELNRKVTDVARDDARGRLRRRLPRGRRPHRQARLHPRRRGGARSSTPSRCCAAWRARSSRCSAGAWSSTAAATPRWTPRAPPSGSAPTEAIVVYRRTRDRMPAHDFEVEEAEEEGVLMKWLSTIKQADEGKLVIEKMELDETGFPQPTGELEELEADSLVLALGQETDLSLLDGVPGHRGRGRRGAGRAEHDDRPPGDLRRRRHGARRAHGDGRRSATARRRPATSTPGCAGVELRAAAQARARHLRHAQHLVLRGRAADRAARSSRSPAARSTFDEVVGRPRRVATRCSRRAAACRAATASPATTATGSAPTTP